MKYQAQTLMDMSEHFKFQISGDRKWTLVLNGDKKMIYPLNECQFLFRGQNKRYKPSHPSILRRINSIPHLFHELPLYDQAKILVRHARICWFVEELDNHPIFQWVSANDLFVDEMALAQHYEIPTGWMDVSQSFDVAAFFATCYLDNDLNWKPCSNGVGIIYRIERRKIDQEFLEPVGLQPFPRPLEQWAWLVEVPMGYDFENHPAISYIEFEHDLKVSQHFLDLFQNGTLLFPPDPLNKVAEHIKQSPEINQRHIERAMKSYNRLDGGLKSNDWNAVFELIKAGINVSSTEVSILTKEEKFDIEQEWMLKKDEFGSNITPFVVRAERRK